jgi:hypothetical protein
MHLFEFTSRLFVTSDINCDNELKCGRVIRPATQYPVGHIDTQRFKLKLRGLIWPNYLYFIVEILPECPAERL